MYLKIHETLGRDGKVKVTLALCDANLLGKKYVEGDAALDLVTYASFYQGERVNEADAGEALVKHLKGTLGPGGRLAASYNIVGQKSVVTAQKYLNVKKEHVKTIDGVPHVHVYRL